MKPNQRKTRKKDWHTPSPWLKMTEFTDSVGNTKTAAAQLLQANHCKPQAKRL